KDMIIESAFAAHSSVGGYAFAMGVAAALMTSFYSWRLIFMTFFGESRASKDVQDHVHESPQVMLFPLYILAAGAVASGFLFHEYFIGANYDEFWAGSLFLIGENIMEAAHHVPAWVVYSPFVAMVIGFATAYYFYIKEPSMPGKFVKNFRFLHAMSLNKWYFDELYDIIFIRPAMKLGYILWKRGDEDIIDRYGPDGVSAAVVRVAEKFKKLQTGYLYHYAFAMLIGLSAFVSWFALGGN
ncbi:MAG: NADH-quinone oxidoreductase subunit L, partial [Kordiimonadaceae bacterium]|nr:NADH-quinone oxidoreductase subunit L [Kordiimonadaceae bacterium]